jgi:hypothetical protein
MFHGDLISNVLILNSVNIACHNVELEMKKLPVKVSTGNSNFLGWDCYSSFIADNYYSLALEYHVIPPQSLFARG